MVNFTFGPSNYGKKPNQVGKQPSPSSGKTRDSDDEEWQTENNYRFARIILESQ